MGWIFVSFLIAVIKYHSKSNLMEKGLILATVEGTVHHDKASGTEGSCWSHHRKLELVRA